MNQIQRWETGGSPASAPRHGDPDTIRRHRSPLANDDVEDVDSVDDRDLAASLSPAAMDAFVEAVVDRIERRVVDELERRGGRPNWRSF